MCSTIRRKLAGSGAKRALFLYNHAGGEMELDLPRKLRHDLRGRWHALSLCMTALDLSDNPAEKVEMLDLLTQSADEIVEVVDQMQDLPDIK